MTIILMVINDFILMAIGEYFIVDISGIKDYYINGY